MRSDRSQGRKVMVRGAIWAFSAACGYFFFLFSHIERGRKWDLGQVTSGLNTWFPERDLSSSDNPRSMSKWLYNLSSKRVHFWEGKRVLWTIKVDNRHKPRLSHLVTLSMRPQGKEEIAQPSRILIQTEKCWLNSRDLGKRGTLTCTASGIQ